MCVCVYEGESWEDSQNTSDYLECVRLGFDEDTTKELNEGSHWLPLLTKHSFFTFISFVCTTAIFHSSSFAVIEIYVSVERTLFHQTFQRKKPGSDYSGLYYLVINAIRFSHGSSQSDFVLSQTVSLTSHSCCKKIEENYVLRSFASHLWGRKWNINKWMQIWSKLPYYINPIM